MQLKKHFRSYRREKVKKQVNKTCAVTVPSTYFFRVVETKTRFFYFKMQKNHESVYFTVRAVRLVCFVETKARFFDDKMRESVYFTVFSVRPKHEISCFTVFLKLISYPGGIQNSAKI